MAFKINGILVSGLGTNGAGVPAGGTSTQILQKNSNVDFDTSWVDAPIIPTKTSEIENNSDFATNASVDEKLQSHRNNTEVHITAEERELWNGANTYTDTAIANLVGSAPDTLNTLEEISKALNEDANYVINLSSKIDQKQDILKGQLNQVVSFDANGNIVYKTLNASDVGAVDANYVETEISAVEAQIDTKQNKNMIVTPGEDGLATYTSIEIFNAVNNGVSVYYCSNENGSTLHPYLEGSDTGVFFYSNYIDNNRVIGTGILIDAEGAITSETYQLDHLTDTTIHITAAEREKWNGINLSNYYSKLETDNLLEEKVNNDTLTQYYTKKESETYVSNAISNIDIGIKGVSIEEIQSLFE